MTLDRRLNAFRADLADVRLSGRVDAAAFVEGVMHVISVPVADLRSAPAPEAGLDTQLLLGDRLRVFERRGGWAWVQAERDGYVGYVEETALGPVRETTHLVAVPRTFVYPMDDMKAPSSAALSMGCGVAVAATRERRGTVYAELVGGGYVIEAHLRRVDNPANDYVCVAETLEWTPYLWGGASGFGIDCSGLVQLSLRMTGRAAPRDTDMQAAGFGETIDGHDLKRGDLIFWKGHVAIATDAQNIIHANGHTMLVSREKLSDAIDRIGYLYGRPTAFKRVP